jgi:hypothetical protein
MDKKSLVSGYFNITESYPEKTFLSVFYKYRINNEILPPIH